MAPPGARSGRATARDASLRSLAATEAANEGGTLSHPAIIAREYGVPAVVGARDATLHIQTGDTVRVDPVDGTVRIVPRPH